MQLTIAICTYRRNQYLAALLRDIANQTGRTQFVVLVVDNASDEACAELCAQFPGVKYTTETTTGLSYARNAALELSTSMWTLFLDDDVRITYDFLSRYWEALQRAPPKVAALGGRYTHLYVVPPPKWLPPLVGEGRRPSERTTEGELPPGDYLSGGTMAVRTALAVQLGGYSVTLGMQGEKLAYAEEDDLQHRFRTAGYTIYYDPTLVMEHVYQPYKYAVAVQLKIAYGQGRDSVTDSPYGIGNLLKGWVRICCYLMPVDVVRSLIRPNYPLQTVAIRALRRLAYAKGRYDQFRRSPANSSANQ